MPPPRLIKIGDVPAWIKHQYGIDPPPTRQTVYNWITQGRGGVKLKSVKKFGNLYISERWLHEYSSHI